MNLTNQLRQIIKRLNSEEKKAIVKFLSIKNESIKKENKSLMLFNLLNSDQVLSSTDVQLTLYGKTNYLAFNKLCNRLKEKTLDTLLLENSIICSNYNKRSELIFILKKKIIQAEILNLKGLRNESDSIVKKIISVSNEYELYDLGIQGLQLREKYLRIRDSQKTIKKIKNQISINENKLKSLKEAQSRFNYILNKIANVSNKFKYLEELNSAIEEIGAFYNLSNSALIKYFYLLLMTEKMQVELRFEKANDLLEEALKVVQEKSVFTNTRIGSVLLSKSDNYVRLFDFKNAMKYAIKSEPYFSTNVVNVSLVLENKFYINYFQGNYEKAKENVQQLMKIPLANNTNLSMNRYNLFYAVLLFISKKYAESIEHLYNLSDIEKDKDGWNINIRVLIIISQIELKEYEKAEVLIENLTKFIRRVEKQYPIERRFKQISKLLMFLSQNYFDFSKLTKRQNDYLVSLNFIDGTYRWKIKSPELIPFEDWCYSKMINSGKELYSLVCDKLRS